MNTKDYEDVVKSLIEHYCLFLVEPVYTENVAAWCRENGYDEPDRNKPLKLIADEQKGCKLIINEVVPEGILDERINALMVRSALTNVAENKADCIDSYKKKLAYLFLSEYAATLPDLEGDEILADEWVFGEMSKLGYFNE